MSPYVSYYCLHPTFCSFVFVIMSKSLPWISVEALSIMIWKATMDLEIGALMDHEIKELIPFPTNTNIVTCKWVFTFKFILKGLVLDIKLA